ncbi:hypothetical protein E4U43_006397, partial [Claviceps pusilla]
MGFRDMLKMKKEEAAAGGDEVLGRDESMRKSNSTEVEAGADAAAAATQFRFLRTDTASQEIIQPSDNVGGGNLKLLSPKPSVRSLRPTLDVFLPSRDGSGSGLSPTSPSSKRRLSERLHLRRSPGSSEHVPQNLPEITTSTEPGDQSQWEKRATMLVGQNLARSSSITTTSTTSPRTNRVPAQISSGVSQMSLADDGCRSRSSSLSPSSPSPGVVSSKAIDEDIQEAIRLHEEGSLAESTKLFGRLADPQGANNPLSQVLYGLAL